MQPLCWQEDHLLYPFLWTQSLAYIINACGKNKCLLSSTSSSQKLYKERKELSSPRTSTAGASSWLKANTEIQEEWDLELWIYFECCWNNPADKVWERRGRSVCYIPQHWQLLFCFCVLFFRLRRKGSRWIIWFSHIILKWRIWEFLCGKRKKRIQRKKTIEDLIQNI
jgi:hypothetical protein